MNGDEILGVLREIRDEAKQTNVRLDQTNARLDQTNARLTSLEGRVDFLERRLSKGFSEMSESLNALARAQADGELRLATEVVSLANVTRELRDVIAEKLTNHEKRLKTLEKHNGPRKR
ncbi:MAG TPA: hypothetical protein VF975_00675 [Thermoanaerobaculia bacterium]